MAKREELHVGSLVWWKRTCEMGDIWDCPWEVTEVTPDGLQLRSFDDFTTTESLRLGNARASDWSHLSDMRICSFREVEDHLTARHRRHEDSVRAAKRDLEDAQSKKSYYAVQADSFLAKHKM